MSKSKTWLWEAVYNRENCKITCLTLKIFIFGLLTYYAFGVSSDFLESFGMLERKTTATLMVNGFLLAAVPAVVWTCSNIFLDLVGLIWGRPKSHQST